ncbi:hypothetical protein KKF34_08205 [Myxococcota bacterium]|nr:hypothetical protein [Myxococcota bacterium]MBU1381612.1 hypothetical protein [Myxococcota bacterium]MBU1496844.1 hypothetical protein [Myxococcota bacterium]
MKTFFLIFLSLFLVNCKSSKDDKPLLVENTKDTPETQKSDLKTPDKIKKPAPEPVLTDEFKLPEGSAGYIWISDKNLTTTGKILKTSGSVSSLYFIKLNNEGKFEILSAAPDPKGPIGINKKYFNYPKGLSAGLSSVKINHEVSSMAVYLSQFKKSTLEKVFKKLPGFKLKTIQVVEKQGLFAISLISTVNYSNDLFNALTYWKQLALNSRIHIEKLAPGASKTGIALNNIKITGKKRTITVEIPFAYDDILWSVNELNRLYIFVKRGGQ